METDRDFDNSEVSVFDPQQRKIVAKVHEQDLADAAATSNVRSKLESQLRAAVKEHYKVA